MLDDLLLPSSLQRIPDLVAIGTQESSGNREDWEISLQETLGPGHVLFHSVELGTLHLAIFLRRDLIWVCSGNSLLNTEINNQSRSLGSNYTWRQNMELKVLNCILTATKSMENTEISNQSRSL